MTATPVTVSITRTVPPERAREFAAWARAGENLMSQFDGYLGSGWVRTEPESPEWHMLLRFADDASLREWENSSERGWWVSTASELAANTRVEERTGIEGWFDEPSRVDVMTPPPPSPPRWKQMISIILVFFPLSLATNAALDPFTDGWPLVLRVLTLVLIVSPIMTYLALPFVTRTLRPWLLKGRI
jgi:hypothetical protein